MRNLTLILTILLTTACDSTQDGPSSLGEPSPTGYTKVIDPGASGVEFITWNLPEEGTTTQISFSLLVLECDGIGVCRWIPDIYGYTQHDIYTPPVRTVVQNAIKICWLTDHHGKVVPSTSSLPDGNGNISFHFIPMEAIAVTLVCDISEDAQSVTIGTNLASIFNYHIGEDREYVWFGTYTTLNSWSSPIQRVQIR